jgi:predicted enzyme related to lactoylglutathione lyase
VRKQVANCRFSQHNLGEENVIKAVKFLGVPVTDQERALRFYTEKLGLKVTTDQPFEGGQRWIELEIPGAETGIVLFTPKGHEDRIGTFVNTSLACDNLELTYSELKARGVEFPSPPTKHDWGSFAVFKDPDGNSFVLSQAG